MRVVGKRPVYLMALLLLSMMNVWSSRASSYGELLASRIVSGLMAAAADATVPSVVADMVAAKDRGHYMMFFHLAMTAGLFVGPLINAYLVQLHNWRWMCYFLAIAVGAVFLLAIFTIRETSYVKKNAEQRGHTRSLRQWMSLTVGYNPESSFLQAFLDILACAAYPPLIWCSLTIGISVGWFVHFPSSDLKPCTNDYQEHCCPTHIVTHLHSTSIRLGHRRSRSPLPSRFHRIIISVLPRRPTHRYNLHAKHKPPRRHPKARVSTSRDYHPRNYWPRWDFDFRLNRGPQNALDWSRCWLRHAGFWCCCYLECRRDVLSGLL